MCEARGEFERNTRTLGDQELTVSALGYGSMGIDMAYGSSDHDGIEAIRKAHDLGITFFVTAELYDWARTSGMWGAVRPFRDEDVIASKFGFTPGGGFDSRPDHNRKLIVASCRTWVWTISISTTSIGWTRTCQIEDVAGTVKEYIDAGKVKYFGLSEAGPDPIRTAHAIQPVSVLQTESLSSPAKVETLFPVLERPTIDLVPYSPLARGFLAGGVTPADQYDESDARRSGYLPWWLPENFTKNERIAKRLEAIASDKEIPPSQLALA